MRVVAAVMLAGCAFLASATAHEAPAAPQRDAVVRMGKGIGKIDLGMTLPQVRRALGGPHVSVYRRVNLGRSFSRPRGWYVELGWELPGRTSWEPVVWQIGFRGASRRGPFRVTRVATTARRERTPKRIGIGSRPRAIVKAYPSATCIERPYPGMPYKGSWIVVEEPRRGGMTAFLVKSRGVPGPSPTPVYVVTVMVQRQWFSKPPGHQECIGDWDDW